MSILNGMPTDNDWEIYNHFSCNSMKDKLHNKLIFRAGTGGFLVPKELKIFKLTHILWQLLFSVEKVYFEIV